MTAFKTFAATFTLLLAGAAFAQAPAPTTPPAGTLPPAAKAHGLKGLDTNKDGQLSKDELKAFRAAHKK